MTGWPGETLTLIDLFVLLGVAVILPLALPSRWWAVTAPAVLVALVSPLGWASAVWVLPWMASSVGLVVRAVDRSGILSGVRDLRRIVEIVAAAFSGVAAVALLQSRLELELFGVGEPIVELTAVHFTFAGVGALTLARLNLVAGPNRWARDAVLLTALAPPVVALGFVTRQAMPQVGGAVLMTAGAWLTGSLHLRAAWRSTRPVHGRVLLAVSGAAVWLPMVLGVGWAAAQHWDVPALSISDMVRAHGSLNGLGFTLCGLLAWRIEGRADDASPGHTHPPAVAVGA